MSENIWNSNWCLVELKTAVEVGIKVILVQIEGVKFGKNKVVVFMISIVNECLFRIKTSQTLKTFQNLLFTMEKLF